MKKWKSVLKRGLFASTAALVGITSAHAQSSVTLYGLIDVELLHRTGVSGGSQTLMTEGLLQGSRWGLKGTEDLGGGWKALFQLENGFAVFSGALDQQGQLFGRQAWVGLSKSYDTVSNTLSFGRQYTIPFALLSNFDTLSWPNDPLESWPVSLMGARFDNTIQYTFQTKNLVGMLQYSVGGQPGSVSVGSTLSTGATYNIGPANIGFALEQSKDAKGNTMKFGGAGGNVTFNKLKLYGMYMLSLRDPNFSAGTAGTSLPLANTSLLSNAGNPNTRRDEVLDFGATYSFTPAFLGTVSLLHDEVSGAMGGDGGLTTVCVVADYFLSKRTDVYAEADYSRLTGAEVHDPDVPSGSFAGARSRTGLGVGIRTRF